MQESIVKLNSHLSSYIVQLVSGLANANSGNIKILKTTSNGAEPSTQTSRQLAEQVGLVFQFPERHFLGDTLLEVIT